MTDTDKPERPADPRPNDEPYYLDGGCKECDTALEPEPYAASEGWHDEFHCPECEDAIYMDWPEAERERIFEDVAEFTPGEFIDE